MSKRLFLITSLDQGGIETYLLRFLSYDKEACNIVMCKSGKYGELYEKYAAVVDGLSSRYLGYGNLWAYWRFFLYLRHSDFDVICDFTGNFAGLTLFMAKLAGIKKRIAFYRGSTNHFKETHFKLWYNAIVKRLVLYSSTKILSNSIAALDFFFPTRDKNSKRFEVIYNGIDIKRLSYDNKEKLRQEFHIPATAFVVGHTGRCNEAKNQDTILKVAIKLCNIYPDIHFVLVGKGVKEKYASVVEQENLIDQIHLLGYRSDVIRILSSFDLYYFPSLTEGQPNALIEAMVTGLPIVASNIGPIQECVPEEMRNLLIPPCDEKTAIGVIKDIYLQKMDANCYKCMEWARQHFDANGLFARFQEEL